jgi:hypothetical protein
LRATRNSQAPTCSTGISSHSPSFIEAEFLKTQGAL